MFFYFFLQKYMWKIASSVTVNFRQGFKISWKDYISDYSENEDVIHILVNEKKNSFNEHSIGFSEIYYISSR